MAAHIHTHMHKHMHTHTHAHTHAHTHTRTHTHTHMQACIKGQTKPVPIHVQCKSHIIVQCLRITSTSGLSFKLTFVTQLSRLLTGDASRRLTAALGSSSSTTLMLSSGETQHY